MPQGSSNIDMHLVDDGFVSVCRLYGMISPYEMFVDHSIACDAEGK